MRGYEAILFGFLMFGWCAVMLTFAIFMRRHGKRQDRAIREMRALASQYEQKEDRK